MRVNFGICAKFNRQAGKRGENVKMEGQSANLELSLRKDSSTNFMIFLFALKEGCNDSWGALVVTLREIRRIKTGFMLHMFTFHLNKFIKT